jgi:hypothetical protein
MLNGKVPSHGWSNLPAGTPAMPGIYVVSHMNPPHLASHEFLIKDERILPHCRLCTDVRFSLKCSPPKEIDESDLFDSPSDPAVRTPIPPKTCIGSHRQHAG